jgi:LCP family protein required for cell wall assembly
MHRVNTNPLEIFNKNKCTDIKEPPHKPALKVKITNNTDSIKNESNKDEVEHTNVTPHKNMINILLIGADYAPERKDWKKNYYSDVMMVLAIDFDKNCVDMISVPRDTFAPIYNTPGIYKLNSALHHGGGVDGDGFKYVVESVRNVLGGIEIDYYMGVNMYAVKGMVDAIGGVYYDVDVEFTMQGRKMEMGKQHLDGQQVLDYCRARKGIDNDIGRVGRQKKMLIAIFNKLKSKNMLFKVPEIIKVLEENVHTNLSFEQLCALAVIGKNIDSKNIRMHTVDGHFLQIFNWSFYVLDDSERIDLIKDVYGFIPEPLKEASQKYARLKWATIQGEGYIEIAKNAMEKYPNKISASDKMLLQETIKSMERALETADKNTIEKELAVFKQKANPVFARSQIRIKWFVNENPGKERMTG